MGYYRSQERNHRLKKLYNKTKNSYGAGVWYNEEKDRYIKYSCGRGKFKRHLKKLSNKKTRKYQGDVKHCNYKKIFDYWWELY